MGVYDIEDEVEDILEENYVQEVSNRYLSCAEEAVGLIAKIIPLAQNNAQSLRTRKKLDNMLSNDFLSSFGQVQLNNAARLQIKLESLADKLVEQKKFAVLKNKPVVGIGGKFSAGKSKFINSILKAGEELLPEDQNPTTSIPTYIVYGQNEEISAYTTDNGKVSLDVEALQALTHKFYEKYAMGFSAFINSLIISEPDMPFKELVFLDTPGYSKADSIGKEKNQKELTDANKAYIQLRGVDYLIWVTDVENGELSEPDLAFISKLGLETPILIVVNKADKKIDEQIEEIVNKVETTVKDEGINVFAVTAYSSRDNVEWRAAGQISKFLNQAMTKKKNNEDIPEQIAEIQQMVFKELEEKIDAKVKERNMLNDVIFESDNIMEIKTLVDLYGESMEEIRDLRASQKQFQSNIKKLDRTLEEYYSGR